MPSQKKIAFIFFLLLIPACFFVFTNIAKADCGEGEVCVPACASGFTQTSNTCNVNAGGLDFTVGVCCKQNPQTTPTTQSMNCGSGGKGTCTPNSSGADIPSECGAGTENIGAADCPTTGFSTYMAGGYMCCYPKQQQTNAAQTNQTSASSPATPSSSNSGGISGLVPCRNNCTLCHLILGFKKIFDFLLGLLFIATILIITVAGVFYMVSSGSKGMMDKAKKALTYALIAFFIGMGSWLLVNIVMQMVGYQHPTGGNWWQFTCDTAQTRGPAMGSGGTPITGGTAGTTGTGSGGSPFGTGLVSSGQKTLDQIVANMRNTVYDNGRQGWTSDGTFHGDCSSWAQEFYKEAYGIDPGGSTAQMRQNANGSTDRSTLTPGDLLIVNGSHGDGTHAVIYLGGDSVIGNSGVGRNVRDGTLSGYSTISAVIKAPSK